MHDIDWAEPILPQFRDEAWEQEVRSVMGRVPDILRRTSRIPWLRKAVFYWPRYKPVEFSSKLTDICGLVTAQENACRYCYGVARSQMRLYGYSEKMIRNIEREVQLAELDEKERAFVQFCRNLSRSNPRPPKQDRQQLIEMGYSPAAVAEMAFLIGNNCFINRVSTFLAIPPMSNLESLPDSLMGRLLRPFIARRMKSWAWQDNGALVGSTESFPGVVHALGNIPAAKAINDTFQEAFESDVLSKELKVLMFAVVARSLECTFCESETRSMAKNLGFSQADFDHALSTLSSPSLDHDEQQILAWTRDTVHFQPGPMQRRIKKMAEDIDDLKLLEAFGVAALANTTVRIAVLLD